MASPSLLLEINQLLHHIILFLSLKKAIECLSLSQGYWDPSIISSLSARHRPGKGPSERTDLIHKIEASLHYPTLSYHTTLFPSISLIDLSQQTVPRRRTFCPALAKNYKLPLQTSLASEFSNRNPINHLEFNSQISLSLQELILLTIVQAKLYSLHSLALKSFRTTI